MQLYGDIYHLRLTRLLSWLPIRSPRLGAIVRACRIVLSKYLLRGVPLAAAFVCISGAVFEARAQADMNIQSRVQSYTLSLVPSLSDIQQITDNTGACLSDPVFILILSRHAKLKLPPLPPGVRDENHFVPGTHLIDTKSNPLVIFFNNRRQLAANVLADFFRSHPDRQKIEDAVRLYYSSQSVVVGIKALPGIPIPLCSSQLTAKLSIPLNPTGESNILKSSQNNSPGASLGLGGALQVFVPVPDKFDVVGFSVTEQTVRYGEFTSKSFDAVTTQAAYQIFLGASGYKSNGQPSGPIDSHTPKPDIPPQNMITIDSVAFGFQNQTVYTPTFHSESVDLFTPQVTYNVQNLPIAGHKGCDAAIPDPRKEGFCYYADFAFTAGQTFSDVASQQNVNFAVSVTPGWRIPNTDFKLTLPMTATARAYENVVGGRNDVLLQIGPALTYAPPPIFDAARSTYSVMFSLSATYNQNFSTVTTASWRGYIFMPTLTVAFQPPPKA